MSLTQLYCNTACAFITASHQSSTGKTEDCCSAHATCCAGRHLLSAATGASCRLLSTVAGCYAHKPSLLRLSRRWEETVILSGKSCVYTVNVPGTSRTMFKLQKAKEGLCMLCVTFERVQHHDCQLRRP